MLYEVRTYRAVPGRMPDLMRRTKDHALSLFSKHGLELVFIGQTHIGDDSLNELTYVLRHASYEQMFERWSSFIGDEEWNAVRAETEAAGPLVVSVRRSVLTDAYFS
ncbi:MAG: hypothetical protein QOI62_2915 [Solirubrobacteraceae bacterium]|jgi:hypothetical protein|nr:hypothetical protein [Solirubrobacteraceae bacterium]MEA2276575.1 hypothetical protein [Solirubrobacteraceae bacterium]MEA2359655.1 hypothetical protein [Solirubrobacteraceae bacterium]MEA2394942.1 hypothetical protein [Solirubrobacteraceae bacterium]